ncbi:MAG: hypothetical protein PUE32_01915 [Clostridia bacterium]|nr:hypothetical protein [Clostridia bacterium]
MVGLMSLLLGEVLFEGARFVIMLLLLVVAVVVGGKLKTISDAKKARKAKKAELEEKNIEGMTATDNN